MMSKGKRYKYPVTDPNPRQQRYVGSLTALRCILPVQVLRWSGLLANDQSAIHSPF